MSDKGSKYGNIDDYMKRIRMLENFKKYESFTGLYLLVPEQKLLEIEDYLESNPEGDPTQETQGRKPKRPRMERDSGPFLYVAPPMRPNIVRADLGLPPINRNNNSANPGEPDNSPGSSGNEMEVDNPQSGQSGQEKDPDKIYGPDKNGEFYTKEQADQLNMALAIRKLDFDHFKNNVFNANVRSQRDMHYNYCIFKYVFFWLLDAWDPRDESVDDIIGNLNDIFYA